MIRFRLVQIILLPFSLLYGLSIGLRNLFYKSGLLKRVSFSLPVISVGNISVGGTGKSPHIEHLIRILEDHIHVATLSRGYGRKTKGFLWVNPRNSSLDVGDEPLQFKWKFPHIPVAVCENRVLGVVQMLKENPQIETILLDDAFQHLPIDPGLNILLTEYSRPYYQDFLLPSGRLREWTQARHRSDICIVTKCPEHLTSQQMTDIQSRLKLTHQPVFFTRYQYGDPYFILDRSISVRLGPDTDVILISAVANVDYLSDWLSDHCRELKTMEFEDHHYFSKFEMGQLHRSFENFGSDQKIILTTEKDATRLLLHHDYIVQQELPIFIIPLQVKFLDGQEDRFNQIIRDYLISFES